jgi:hypothetical protein
MQSDSYADGYDAIIRCIEDSGMGLKQMAAVLQEHDPEFEGLDLDSAHAKLRNSLNREKREFLKMSSMIRIQLLTGAHHLFHYQAELLGYETRKLSRNDQILAYQEKAEALLQEAQRLTSYVQQLAETPEVSRPKREAATTFSRGIREEIGE